MPGEHPGARRLHQPYTTRDPLRDDIFKISVTAGASVSPTRAFAGGWRRKRCRRECHRLREVIQHPFGDLPELVEWVTGIALGAQYISNVTMTHGMLREEKSPRPRKIGTRYFNGVHIHLWRNDGSHPPLIIAVQEMAYSAASNCTLESVHRCISPKTRPYLPRQLVLTEWGISSRGSRTHHE